MSQDEKRQERPAAKRRPVFDCRAGMVKVAVWENEGGSGPFPTATFSRLYKDSDNTWKSASSFNVWDLADLARCAFSAEAYMLQHYGSSGSDDRATNASSVSSGERSASR